MSVKISVIVPVYNVKQYLNKCVDSLLAQDFQDFEIVLVDDGSTDGSGLMCDELAEKYEKIICFHKENGGLSSARNFGVANACGELVTFVDSDDYVSETYLSDLYNLMRRYDADMAFTRVVLQTEKEIENDIKGRYVPQFVDYCTSAKEAFIDTYIRQKIGWSACGKLFPLEWIKENPFPYGFYEEMATTYQYIEKCKRVAIGDYKNNYHYIAREGSITHRPLSRKHYRIFEVCGEIRAFINEKYPDKKKFIPLIYENAVLQLLTKIEMSEKQYNDIFLRYRKAFRKHLVSILTSGEINIKRKYYAVILCTTPKIFRLQRIVFEKLR